jgi:acetyl-CoA carboxylase biotin carboxyl carrier protein
VRRDSAPAPAPVFQLPSTAIAGSQAPAPPPAPPAGPIPIASQADVPDTDVELAVVKSPIVGTFYRSPEPGAAAFVEIGATVKKGQVLCIIEAMKLMNEIDSEYDGEIVNVYVESGQPVQYGERLFAIRTK